VRKFGEVRGVPFMRGSRVVAVIAVARDITRRIEMEKSLRESEEKYDIHFSLTNDVLYSVDPEFRITSVSPSVERVLGYKPEELVGKPFQDLGVLDPDSLDKAASDTLRVLSGEKIYSSIYKFITKDGVRKFGEVSGVPLMQDGSAAAVISVARDITERIEMEKSLRESEERFRTIFESARDCVFIKNLDLEYEFVNPCMEKLFELRSDEVMGQRDRDLFGEGSESLTNESDLRVIGGEIVEEEHSKLINGILRTFHIIKVPMRDSTGLVKGLCGIARDITERKRFEEELMTKERELAHQARYLEEMNIALKVLLDSREKEKKQAQEIMVSKAQKIIHPYLEKMEAGTLDEENSIYLSIIKSNLQELLSPYVGSVSLQYLNFTPMEMRIADLIKHGRSTKEISSLLNISSFAVSFHRSNIRKKCGLINSRKNLRSYLHGAEQAKRKNR
jgi:PAS domain S-box-containing protein